MHLTKVLLDGQGAMLEALLPAAGDPPHMGDPRELARRRLTDRLTELVMRLTIILEPRVVIEIGAFEAAFSIAMKAALPQARVLAFEANPRVHALHHPKAVAAGVEYENLCICEVAGHKTLSVPIRPDGRHRMSMGSLLPERHGEPTQDYDIASDRLDSRVSPASNVLWIDVEGAIEDVLAGAVATLAHTQALFVEVESEEYWKGQWTDIQVIAHLAAFGLRPVLRDVQRPVWQYNLLFVQEGLLERADVRAVLAQV